MRKIQIAVEAAQLPLDEVVEQQGAEIVESGENLAEATEALEAFALLLQPGVEGYAIPAAAFDKMAAVTNRVVTRAGLPVLAVGTESVQVASLQQAASLGLEDIKEHLKNAGKAVVEFLKKCLAWIKDSFTKLYDSVTNVFKRAKPVLESVTAEDLKAPLNKNKAEGQGIDLSHFFFNGKLSSKLGEDLGKSFVKDTDNFEKGAKTMGDFMAACYEAADKNKTEHPKLFNQALKSFYQQMASSTGLTSDGFNVNSPSRHRHGLRLEETDFDFGFNKLVTPIERGEPMIRETSLERLGITVDNAKTLAKELDGLAAAVKIIGDAARVWETEATDAIADGDKLFHAMASAVATQTRFGLRIVHGLVAALQELTKAIKAAKAAE